MRRTLPIFALASLAVVASGSANAYAVFSGVDANGSPTRLPSTPNSAAADSSFRSMLSGVNTETFEGQNPGAMAPLQLNFGAAGTATLTGGGGRVTATDAANTIAFGRYSVPAGTNYWDVTAGAADSFQITFSQEVAAFGFYGIDIGDFQGTLQLDFVNSANVVISSLNVPAAPEASANGSVLYFGVIASNSAELFRSIRFNTTGGTTGVTDVFGFDSMTIGTQAQVVPPGSVPEPGSLALAGLALLGLGYARRRRS